jgi:hypothetical protein
MDRLRMSCLSGAALVLAVAMLAPSDAGAQSGAPPAAPTTAGAPAQIKIFKSGTFRARSPKSAPMHAKAAPANQADYESAADQVFGPGQLPKLTKRTLDLQHGFFAGEASLVLNFGVPSEVELAAAAVDFYQGGSLDIIVHSSANKGYLFDVAVRGPDANCQFVVTGPDQTHVNIPCAADASKAQHLMVGLQATKAGANHFVISNPDAKAGKHWTFYSVTVTAQ